MPTWEEIGNMLARFGIVRGLFVIFFIVAHVYLFRQYRGRLEDRQKEIDRLAQDNREYRDRFLKVLDEYFGLLPKAENFEITARDSNKSLPEPEKPPAALPKPDGDEGKLASEPKELPPESSDTKDDEKG